MFNEVLNHSALTGSYRCVLEEKNFLDAKMQVEIFE